MSIVVDNRPDAAAVMGAAIVTKARPDGYTFYASDNSFYQNPAILDSLPHDTLKDFTAVTMLAQGPVILLVHPDVPARTLPELIALARKTPLTYASRDPAHRARRHRRGDARSGRRPEARGARL